MDNIVNELEQFRMVLANTHLLIDTFQEIAGILILDLLIVGSYVLYALLKHNALYARNDLKLGTFKDPFAIFYQIL